MWRVHTLNWEFVVELDVRGWRERERAKGDSLLFFFNFLLQNKLGQFEGQLVGELFGPFVGKFVGELFGLSVGELDREFEGRMRERLEAPLLFLEAVGGERSGI